MGRLVPWVVGLMLLCIAGCAGGTAGSGAVAQQPGASAEADQSATPGALPAPATLPKNTSGFKKLLGSQYYLKYSAWVNQNTLVLKAPLLVDPGDDPSKGSSAAGQSRAASATTLPFAYGIFLFSDVELLPATLRIDTGQYPGSKLWVAFANWDTNSWDFSFGSYFPNPTIDISDPKKFDPFIDDQGRIAVALVETDPANQVEVNSLEVTLLSEVSELTANNFRWDGVKLNWWAPTTTDGFRVLRRKADDMTGSWTPATQDPLARFDRSFLDTGAQPGIEYTYLVQSGYLRQPNGVPRWFWSPGAMVNGQRQVSEVEVDTGDTGRHLPFLTGNKLGFFVQQLLSPDHLDGLRNQRFTPGLGWDVIGTDGGGYTPIALVNDPEFSFPLMEHHTEQVNNPVCSLIYSTLSGTVCQVADRQADDTLIWRNPVAVRGANTRIVALVDMPRRIGAVVFNKSNGMLELVDSADINGRIWYDYDPANYPWMDIGHYHPEGRVAINPHTVDPVLCFSDADDEEMKFLAFDYAGWLDQSPPGIQCAPGPAIATGAPPLGLPETKIFYISPERDELRVLTRDIYGVWQPDETQVLVSVEPGSQLKELALFTAGEISAETYLVYNVDGNLYAMRSMSTAFASWTPPAVLDDAGTCRDVQIIKVGTDSTWDSHHYASYIKDKPDGDGKLISFRDLYQATMNP